MAMHAHSPAGTKRFPPNGIFSTSFEAVKDDEDRMPHHPEAQLYNRRRNILGASVAPTKSCKMTTTSIISKLLQTSRHLRAESVDNGVAALNTLSPVRKAPLTARRLTKIFYGSSAAASVVPSIPRLSLRALDGSRKHVEPVTHPKARDLSEPLVPPHRPVSVPLMPPRAQASPRKFRPRPITCGGPAIMRVIQAPPSPS
jgi:hypothetical protein